MLKGFVTPLSPSAAHSVFAMRGVAARLVRLPAARAVPRPQRRLAARAASAAPPSSSGEEAPEAPETADVDDGGAAW